MLCYCWVLVTLALCHNRANLNLVFVCASAAGARASCGHAVLLLRAGNARRL